MHSIYKALCIFTILSTNIMIGCSSGKSADSESTKNVVNVKIIPFGRFSSAFNDLNDSHLEAAQKNGITPVTTRDEAIKKRKLKEIKTCRYYVVDPLTHSIPFLVPSAKDLLETIGENFIDLLDKRGGGRGYKIIVTSVLRVDKDITKLRKRNGNASANSAHRFGTTFDIAYTRFDQTDQKKKVPEAQLKHLLAETILALKKDKRCYVKYEVNQGCFHITVR